MTHSAIISELPLDQWVHSDEDTIYHVGSRAEGFGNARSDVDLIGVYDSKLDDLFLDAPVSPRPGVKVLMLVHEGYRVHLRAHTYDSLHRLGTKVNSVSGADLYPLNMMSRAELELYYRTANGIPVVNKKKFEELQGSFSKPHIESVLDIWSGVKSAIAMCRSHMYRGLGDYSVAFLFSRSAVEWAVDSFLARQGEAFPSRKWRFEKLKRKFGESSEYYSKAWDLNSLGDKDVRTYLKESAEFCKQLGIDRFPPFAVGDLRPLREEQTNMFTVGNESYLIQNKASAYTLDSIGKQMWELMDGSTSIAEIATKLTSGTDGKWGTTKRLVIRNLARFDRLGLTASLEAA